MKLLFFNNELGGQLRFRGDVMEHFIAQGHEVLIVTPDDPHKDVYNHIPAGARFIPFAMNRTSVNPLTDLSLLWRFYQLLRRERPDYVFNYTIKPNIYGAIAAHLCGIHCTDMMAGLGIMFINNTFPARMARLLYRFSLRYADYLLLLNQWNVERVEELKLCNPSKIIWLKGGEGVNLNKYPRCDNASDSTTFLFIARLIVEKGYDDFVAAARLVKARYPEARFVVAGDFDLTFPNPVSVEQVEADVRSGVIEYVGHKDDMNTLYAVPGTVVCMPSFYAEGLNRALIEGCATGKPVITTDKSGCRETVIDGLNGYMVAVHDVEGLAQAMIRYIELPAETKQAFSQASYELAVKHFNVEEVYKVYDEILQRVTTIHHS